MALSESLGGKVSTGENVLSSHEQETYPTTSFDGNGIEFEFYTDQDLHVNLGQSYLALKVKRIKGSGYETYNSTQVEKEALRNGKNG